VEAGGSTRIARPTRFEKKFYLFGMSGTFCSFFRSERFRGECFSSKTAEV
jgi:hypothetical protein